MMDKKALKILRLLRHRQMTRSEIAEALHEDIERINELIELLHTHFQYIRLSIVSDDIIHTEQPAPKYSITVSGCAYLMSECHTQYCRMALAAAAVLFLAGIAGFISSSGKKERRAVIPDALRESS